jgi:outer membrane protein assembly factor BamB
MNRRTGSARVLDAANGGRNPARALAFGGVRARVGALLLVAAAVGGGLPAAAARASTDDLAVAFQINVAHSGVQADAALAPPLVRRWQVSLPGAVSYPLIAQGMVYVTIGIPYTGKTMLYALDQSTGSVVWSQPLPYSLLPWANAAYDAGRIYVIASSNPICCHNSSMNAYDAATGAPLWTTELYGSFMFSSAPTAANGVVYTGGAGDGSTVYAVDEATGRLLGNHSVLGGDHSSPALSDTGVFVSYACNQAYGFSQRTLAPLWHYSTDCYGGGGRTVVYANGRVYTRDYLGNLILDAATGSLLGSFTSGGPYVTTAAAPAIDQNNIVMLTWPTFSPDLTTLSSQSLADGSTRWTFRGDGQLDTAPIVLSTPTGEFVVEGSSTGMLYALDATTGAVVWSTNVGAAIPPPNEQGVGQPQTGLGAGQGLLVVPAGNTVTAYGADITAPTIAVPATLTIRTASASGSAASYTVTASDPDDTATVSCSPASGSVVPVGTTIVNCTATDTAGNTANASFDIVVDLDTTAPTIIVPATITAKATSSSGATVSYAVTASDPDDAATVGCSPLSGSSFPVGATPVNCTATDTLGNTSTAGFLVVVSAPNADCNLSHYPVSKGILTLKNANLAGCYLPGANLSGANATNANLTGAYLAGANLSAANLSQAQMQRSVLDNANLSAAKLNLTVLTGASMTGATLTGVTWAQTTCPDGTNSNNNGYTCTGHLG